jgi:hypothetical protein
MSIKNKWKLLLTGGLSLIALSAFAQEDKSHTE